MNIIEKFNKIRDIPYRIPLSDSEEDHCCNGKVKMLKAYLDKNGYESRYRVCEFHWSDLNLPKKILSIPHEDDSLHVFLEIKLNDHWIQLDPTWDRAIRSVLPVNEWDGENSTKIAVKVITIYDVAKSKEIMNQEGNEDDEEDLKKNGRFYKALNKWLEGIRSSF